MGHMDQQHDNHRTGARPAFWSYAAQTAAIAAAAVGLAVAVISYRAGDPVLSRWTLAAAAAAVLLQAVVEAWER